MENKIKVMLKNMIKLKEKKLPDETVFRNNKEKAGNAKELEKAGNLERKRLVFGINCKVLKMLVFGENKIKDEHGKVMRFGKNKI